MMRESNSQEIPNKKVPHLLFKEMLRLSVQTCVEQSHQTIDARMVAKLERLLNTNHTELTPLIPLIYKKIKGQEQNTPLSEKLIAKMKYIAHQAIAVDMENQQVLSNVFNEFAKNDIKVILLKSAAFSGTIYSSAAPRIGVDLDILIQQQDIQKAFAVISQIASPKEVPTQRAHSHHTSFEHSFILKPQENTEVIIELHTGFFHQGLFSEIPHAFWHQSVPHPAYTHDNVRMLCPEHNLIHLAIHAFGNLSYTHHNVLDAHELISQNEINWPLLYECASTMRSRKALYALLTHSISLFGTSVSMAPETPLKLKGRNTVSIKIASGLPDKLNLPFKGLSYRLMQLLIWPIMCDRTVDFLLFQKDYFNKRKQDLWQCKSSKE
jgi:hypothetical protein